MLHTKCRLISVLSEKYKIKEVTAEYIKEGIEKETALLIIPGGVATPYRKKLDGFGTDQIKKYVERGGGYLGFGAGAYFAGKEVIFYPNNPDPGMKKIYYSFSGARLIDIKILSKDFFKDSIEVYYNGWGYFDPSFMTPNVEIIALYDSLAYKFTAIVECVIGRGKAILSEVHAEYNIQRLQADNSKDQRFSLLQKMSNDKQSLEFLKFLLRKFQIIAK